MAIAIVTSQCIPQFNLLSNVVFIFVSSTPVAHQLCYTQAARGSILHEGARIDVLFDNAEVSGPGPVGKFNGWLLEKQGRGN